MSNLRNDVGAWAHFYAPEPLKTKLERLLVDYDAAIEALEAIAEGETPIPHEQLASAILAAIKDPS